MMRQHAAIPAAARPTGQTANAAGTPRALRWILLGMVALIVLHLLIPIIMVAQRGTIVAGIRNANPTFGSAELDAATNVTLGAGAIFHFIFVALYAWFGAKTRAGRNWSRIALTATLVVATFASAVSFSTSPLFRLIIPLVDLLQIALIVLLWVPRPVRDFFSATERQG